MKKADQTKLKKATKAVELKDVDNTPILKSDVLQDSVDVKPMVPSGRFDYVKYDDHAVSTQASIKAQFENLDRMLDASFGACPRSPKVARARATAVTKLEEAYMWIGKAIRDDQIARSGEAKAQEERCNS